MKELIHRRIRIIINDAEESNILNKWIGLSDRVYLVRTLLALMTFIVLDNGRTPDFMLSSQLIEYLREYRFDFPWIDYFRRIFGFRSINSLSIIESDGFKYYVFHLYGTQFVGSKINCTDDQISFQFAYSSRPSNCRDLYFRLGGRWRNFIRPTYYDNYEL